jgi:hypothetical protein
MCFDKQKGNTPLYSIVPELNLQHKIIITWTNVKGHVNLGVLAFRLQSLSMLLFFSFFFFFMELTDFKKVLNRNLIENK